MLTITFLNLETRQEETENFASYAVWEMLEDSIPVAILKWEHFNEQGQKTGGDKGMNASVTLRMCHADMDQEVIDDLAWQMSVNVD